MNNLLNCKQVSERLSVKEGTIRRWVFAGKIDKIKINGIVRFRSEDVEKLIEASYRPATARKEAV